MLSGQSSWWRRQLPQVSKNIVPRSYPSLALFHPDRWIRHGHKYQDNIVLMPVGSNIFSSKGVSSEFTSLALNLLAATRSRSSWKQTSTTLNKINEMSTKFNLDLNLPWNKSKRLNFCLALLKDGLRSSSIRNYLSQTNTIHRLLGEECPGDDALLKAVLKGSENTEECSKKTLAITPVVLNKLRDHLKQCSSMHRTDRRMIWAACCTMFHGSLRVNEALCGGRNSVTPHDLTGEKMKIIHDSPTQSTVCVLSLFCPKEQRKGLHSAQVELFELGTRLCPIRALQSYLSCPGKHLEHGVPVFRWNGGDAFSRQDMQKFLKSAIGHLETKDTKIGTHGFRAGLVTILGIMGEPVELIELVGRWHSSAWQSYCKLGRTARGEDARRLAKKMSEAASFEQGLVHGIPLSSLE